MSTNARSHPVRLIVAGVALLCAALGLVVATAGRASASTVKPTVQKVIRPVRANGTPAAGFRVLPVAPDLRGVTVDCFDTAPAAVDPNIRQCFPTATGAAACWKSSKHTVLCVADLAKRTLVRFRYSGTFAKAAAPKHPTPFEVILRTRINCYQRFGGAFPTVNGHPSWFAQYTCNRGVTLYGPSKNAGLVTSFAPWLAHAVTFTGARQYVYDAGVADAYYLGTAR